MLSYGLQPIENQSIIWNYEYQQHWYLKALPEENIVHKAIGIALMKFLKRELFLMWH